MIPEPPLVFTDNRDTEVGVTFLPAGAGTRVTSEHQGLDRLAPDVSAQVRRHGWFLLLPWYGDHLRRQR